MGRILSQSELTIHKKQALARLDSYLDSLINDPNHKNQSKSDKLSYWLEDWTTYLEFEPKFIPSKLRRYKRGEIIKAHLGYNVGSEEGGLHYCVVLDKNNPISSPVITVLPLTSVKSTTNIKNLKDGKVYLGNELFTSLSSKISTTRKKIDIRITDLSSRIDNVSPDDITELISIKKELNVANKEKKLLFRMMNEVAKMRSGSIALTNQITTISKIRIYDPKTNFDILSNVKLSNDKLDLLDREIIKNFTGIK
ncbi:type II toxin-antitoxin system PemK/MazF family toxin [Blautia stercoris]|jgi:mRNA-degrading endonuclease toxin of MazEF toxin-antitoxin module